MKINFEQFFFAGLAMLVLSLSGGACAALAGQQTKAGSTLHVCNDAFDNPLTTAKLSKLPVIKSNKYGTCRYASSDCEIWLSNDKKSYWVGVQIKPGVDLDVATGIEY